MGNIKHHYIYMLYVTCCCIILLYVRGSSAPQLVDINSVIIVDHMGRLSKLLEGHVDAQGLGLALVKTEATNENPAEFW